MICDRGKASLTLVLGLSVVLTGGCKRKATPTTQKADGTKAPVDRAVDGPAQFKTLEEAVRSGDVADVKRHVQRGAAVNTRDAKGETPLHVAATSGQREISSISSHRRPM